MFILQSLSLKTLSGVAQHSGTERREIKNSTIHLNRSKHTSAALCCLGLRDAAK